MPRSGCHRPKGCALAATLAAEVYLRSSPLSPRWRWGLPLVTRGAAPPRQPSQVVWRTPSNGQRGRGPLHQRREPLRRAHPSPVRVLPPAGRGGSLRKQQAALTLSGDVGSPRPRALLPLSLPATRCRRSFTTSHYPSDPSLPPILPPPALPLARSSTDSPGIQRHPRFPNSPLLDL